MLEQLDLSQGTLGQDLLAEDIGDLLDGDALSCRVVGRGAVWSISVLCCAMQCSAARVLFSPDNAVGALAQLLSHVVALVHNKLLVEDLEDLAVREVRHGGGGVRVAPAVFVLVLAFACSCWPSMRGGVVGSWRGQLRGAAKAAASYNCKRVSETR